MSSSIIMLLGVLFVGWYAFTQTDILSSLKGFSLSSPPVQSSSSPQSQLPKKAQQNISPRAQLLATANPNFFII